MTTLEERIGRAAAVLDESADSYAANARANQASSSNDAAKGERPGERRSTSPANVTALRRPRQRGRLVVIAACLVVMLVAGGVVVLTQASDNSPNVSLRPAAQAPDSDISLPYAVPGDVAEITRIGVSDDSNVQDHPTLFSQSYGGSLNGTNVDLKVSITVYPESRADEVGGECRNVPQQTLLSVNGHEGCEWPSVIGGVRTDAIVWQADMTTMLGLKSNELSRDQLLALADSVKPSPDGSRVSLDPVPDGLQPTGTDSAPQADDQNSITILFTHNDCDYSLTRRISATFPYGQTSTSINGYPGAVIGEHTIAWLVRGSSFALSAVPPITTPERGPQPVAASCDPQATAATFQYTDDAAWNQLLADHGSATPTT